MRMTNSLFYTNAQNDYQTNMKKLYDVNTQISSGRKIQNSYEDSGVYIDSMRLDYEIDTLEQVKESSSKAQTFADNTDTTMNQFSQELDKFKTKLIQAANAANSPTSLDALANDLEATKTHLISIANTSINGQFLFSGSALDVKPVSNDGSYNGNGENLTSLVGSEVRLPYNITGEDLFLGKDSDYNKIVSTNVKMYNQTKLHPESDLPEEIYLKDDDTIRDMIGDSDFDKSNDPDAVFYISGRKPNGETFSDKLRISSSSEISDLLEKVGVAYGNTSTNKIVDVSLNDYGQIEIKDLKKGNSLLEFNIFGAVDRSAGAGDVGNADQNDIDDLLANKNIDIISFDKSNFLNQNTASSSEISEDIRNPGSFELNAFFSRENGNPIDETTTLQSFMGSDVENISLNGTDTDGNSQNIDLNVNNTTTVQDLLIAIENNFGVDVRLENGKIIMTDTTLPENPSYGSSSFDLTLSTEDAGGNLINGLATPDIMNYDRRGFEKNGNELFGNVSQISRVTGDYADMSTRLVDVSGTKKINGVNTIDGEQLVLSGIDKNGNSYNATIDLSNGTAGSTFSLDGGITNYTIFDSDGNPTKADDMTYKQLLDVISMITSDTLPEDADTPADGIQFDEYNKAAKDAQGRVETALDYKGRVKILDKHNSKSNIELSLYDANSDSSTNASAFIFMANDAVIVDEPHIDFFKDLDDMIEAVRNGNFSMGADSDDPRNRGVQNALLKIDHILDHVTKEHTKIGSYSNALRSANERAELLSISVQTVKSKISDVDMGEAYMEFTQLSNSYQAMLSTIAKINSISLLNYI